MESETANKKVNRNHCISEFVSFISLFLVQPVKTFCGTSCSPLVYMVYELSMTCTTWTYETNNIYVQGCQLGSFFL